MIILQFEPEEISALKTSTEKFIYVLMKAGHVRTVDLANLLGISDRAVRKSKLSITRIKGTSVPDFRNQSSEPEPQFRVPPLVIRRNQSSGKPEPRFRKTGTPVPPESDLIKKEILIF